MALLRLDWAEKRKSYLLFLLATYAIITIINTYNSIGIYHDMTLIGPAIEERFPLSPGVDRSWDRHLPLLLVAFYIFMLASVNVSRTRIERRKVCINSLVRPASYGEKFARLWFCTVPASLAAFLLVYLAADYTRIGVCQMLFAAPAPFAIPLYKGIGWYSGDEDTRLIFQLFLTLTVLGQSILALKTTLKRTAAHVCANLCILVLPFILGFCFSGIKVLPTFLSSCLLTVWHILSLGLAVICWYATYRRYARVDLEYSYSSNP